MFKLKAKILDVETGGTPAVSINQIFANKNDFNGMDRVLIKSDSKVIVASINLSEKLVGMDEIGIFEEVRKKLNLKDGDVLEIDHVGKPESIKYIRKKMDREELFENEIHSIIKDIVDEKLTEVELAAFVSATYMGNLSMNEIEHLTRSIVENGKRLKIKKRIIADKHCIGGIPGNRTTMVLVPIIASLGITIPKTSSRSITSPAGTADTMEALCSVSFSIEELIEIVKKTNGCIVWGGAINLAAADDKLIKVRHPLSIDPEGLMLASVMAKKYAVGATHVIFDLPIGDEAKLQSLGEARHLEREFQKLAEKLKINVDTIITDGNDPIGHGIGVNLEARDVLWLLRKDKKAPIDLRKKSVLLAGKLLELCGAAKSGEGEKMADKQIESGAAYKKMQEIIEAQGGNPNIKPEDLHIGEFTCDYAAEKKGIIKYMSNKGLSKIARASGAPVDRDAGIFLHKKYGQPVRQGEKIFTVYAKSERNIEHAIKLMKALNPVVVE